MGTLSYATTVSIDGYVADSDGDFQWTAPDDAVFDAHLDRMAGVSTEVLGRKTYELMGYWDTYPDSADRPAAELEFARRWRAIDKVVVSSTMTPEGLTSDRARVAAELSLVDLQRIVERAQGAVEIFGPTTAAEAIRAGLVDDFHLFVVPKIVGGGLRALPAGVRLDLTLAEHWVFDGGITYSRYRRR
ncbi:dihydrofolate reductase family protein [Tomitella fengzijianii]|uniref:Deaminase n=1 Tax=Tomitella fengzijianii TaxID=2597660 RepID=A0A516X269_9ACTN|nr:dihydrofolate reductase family protein [Tomitella fengzijianii]QDQ97186.1 deaminase [Tomitella fengzijianii]